MAVRSITQEERQLTHELVRRARTSMDATGDYDQARVVDARIYDDFLAPLVAEGGYVVNHDEKAI